MNKILLFALPGSLEILLIIFMILLLFGGRKLPALFKGIGEGIQAFKHAQK